MSQPDMSELEAYQARLNRPVIQIPRSPIGRFFFGVALVIWFAILLLPCAMFSLATTGTIRIPHINAPQPETQPFFEINLLMSVEQRGLQFVRSVIVAGSDEQQCVETHVSYLMWFTDGTNENAIFCDCFAREQREGRWTLVDSSLDRCEG